MLGASLRVLGVVSEGSDGISVLRDAVDVLENSQRHLEKARALVDLGLALRRSGQDKASREFLREGSAIARSLGAEGLSERALDELVASGARPRRAAGESVESLTPASDGSPTWRQMD